MKKYFQLLLPSIFLLFLLIAASLSLTSVEPLGYLGEDMKYNSQSQGRLLEIPPKDNIDIDLSFLPPEIKKIQFHVRCKSETNCPDLTVIQEHSMVKPYQRESTRIFWILDLNQSDIKRTIFIANPSNQKVLLNYFHVTNHIFINTNFPRYIQLLYWPGWNLPPLIFLVLIILTALAVQIPYLIFFHKTAKNIWCLWEFWVLAALPAILTLGCIWYCLMGCYLGVSWETFLLLALLGPIFLIIFWSYKKFGIESISHRYNHTKKILFPILLTTITAWQYIHTLLPGIGYSGDTAKWQFIGKVLGTPHATGYPLYILLNRIFITLPIGPIAYRANLLSALYAVLTLLVVYAVINTLVARESVAFLGALLLSCVTAFWSQAVVAEVYTLNALLVSLTLFLLIKWFQTRRVKYFYLFMLVYALSFGNHMTMITIFPAILIFVLITDATMIGNWRIILAGLGSIALGAGQYIYLYIRTAQHAVYLEQQIHSFRDFINCVSGRQFKSQMFIFSWSEIASKRIPLFFSTISEELNLVFLCLALIGLVVLAKEKTKIFVLLFLAWFGESFFIINFGVPDLDVYFIPIFLIIAVFAAAGMAFVCRLAFFRLPLQFAAFIILCVIIQHAIAFNRPLVDQSKTCDDDIKLTAFCTMLPKGSFIVTDNYLDKMYTYYKIDVDFKDKSLHQLEIDTQKDIRQEITSRLSRIVNNHEDVRRYYFPDLESANPFNPEAFFRELENSISLQSRLFSQVYLFSANTQVACERQHVKTFYVPNKIQGKQYPFYRLDIRRFYFQSPS